MSIDSARLLAVSLALVIGALDAVWLAASPLRFSWDGTLPGVALSMTLLVVGLAYGLSGRSERIANLAFDGALLLVFSHVGCVYSYLIVAQGGTLRDEVLVSADAMLGFDWLAYNAFVLDRPALATASLIAYAYTLLLVVLIVVWHSLSGRIARSREFVATIVLGGVLCISIALAVPSAGGVGHFLPEEAFYRGRAVTVDTAYMAEYFALRADPEHVVSLREPKGLIAFPSYHSCMAVLIVLATRGSPAMLAVAFALNAATLAAVPVQGGHHLVDALGGIAVALVAFALVRLLPESDEAGRIAPS